MSKSVLRVKKIVDDNLHLPFEKLAGLMREDAARNDFLGFAAQAKTLAKEAVRDGDFNSAWRHFHEQKAHFMRHADNVAFTRTATIALDASVSPDLANILRLEGRHSDALVHTVYWLATLGTPLPQRGIDKLRAYLNRCKLKNTTLSQMILMVEDLGVAPDFSDIQSKIAGVIGKG